MFYFKPIYSMSETQPPMVLMPMFGSLCRTCKPRRTSTTATTTTRPSSARDGCRDCSLLLVRTAPNTFTLEPQEKAQKGKRRKNLKMSFHFSFQGKPREFGEKTKSGIFFFISLEYASCALLKLPDFPATSKIFLMEFWNVLREVGNFIFISPFI